MLDQHTLFAIAAVVLATVRYGTYLYTIYLGKTKPHAFTWLLLGSVTAVGTYASYAVDAGPSVWALGFVEGTYLFIAGLSFFVGVRGYATSDWVALVICFMAIPIWKLTNNPMLALIIIVVIFSAPSVLNGKKY